MFVSFMIGSTTVLKIYYVTKVMSQVKGVCSPVSIMIIVVAIIDFKKFNLLSNYYWSPLSLDESYCVLFKVAFASPF